MTIWDRVRLHKEKKAFVQQRIDNRSVGWHLTLIIIITWLAAWLVSALLLHVGRVTSLPWRYAMAFLFAYLVFFSCARVWAGAMVRDGARSSDINLSNIVDISDVGSAFAGEGCAFVIVLIAISGLISGIIYLTGGAPLLLEVAFELAFAGTLVRSVGKIERVGDWAAKLFWNTLPHALAAFVVCVGMAAWLQHQAPGTVTFSQAIHLLLAR
jgi:hypothetical protein